MTRPSVLEALLRRDRQVVIAALVFVAGLAWAYTLAGAGMPHGVGGALTASMPWSPLHAALVFLMWWIMMVAMMVPSAAPMVLLFAAIDRKRQAGRTPFGPTWVFLGGYLAAWGGFSLAATLAQWALERSALLSPMMSSASPVFAAGLLVAAGLYQLTPLKRACLRHCRNPIMFLTARWRPGAAGAARMGLDHGAYCVGCCWFLMALLFVGGVMNVVWIAVIAAYVLIEKLVARDRWLSRAVGLALVAWGAVVLVQRS
jgi:predicted metal-binding membrane protein